MSSIEYAKSSRGTYVSPSQIQRKIDEASATRAEALDAFGQLSCPECEDGLIFVRRSDRSIEHFRHESGSSCNGGGEGTLHKVAKRKIVEIRPAFLFRCGRGHEIPRCFQGQYIEELSWSRNGHNYRFDVAVIGPGDIIVAAIEIYSTNSVLPQKQADMNGAKLKWCEVKASDVLEMERGSRSSVPVIRGYTPRCHICRIVSLRDEEASERHGNAREEGQSLAVLEAVHAHLSRMNTDRHILIQDEDSKRRELFVEAEESLSRLENDFKTRFLKIHSDERLSLQRRADCGRFDILSLWSAGTHSLKREFKEFISAFSRQIPDFEGHEERERKGLRSMEDEEWRVLMWDCDGPHRLLREQRDWMKRSEDEKRSEVSGACEREWHFLVRDFREFLRELRSARDGLSSTEERSRNEIENASSEVIRNAIRNYERGMLSLYRSEILLLESQREWSNRNVQRHKDLIKAYIRRFTGISALVDALQNPNYYPRRDTLLRFADYDPGRMEGNSPAPHPDAVRNAPTEHKEVARWALKYRCIVPSCRAYVTKPYFFWCRQCGSELDPRNNRAGSTGVPFPVSGSSAAASSTYIRKCMSCDRDTGSSQYPLCSQCYRSRRQ
jgi:hypothetical protein